jgi:predicted AlkP superfamily phosphohydrolase/phosphomutase
MAKRAVVIGLDGAAWHLLEPLFEAGAMPRLNKLRARGASGSLSSTVPTYTPPAWTSAVTGVNPGRHGIYGFHNGNAQSEKLELVHAGSVKAPTIWEMVNAQSASIGVFNLPLTYPPQAVEDGWMVAGMMTPGYGHQLQGFVYPRELEKQVLDWAPGYEVEIRTSWEEDWRDDALCDRALASLEQRHRVLEGLLETKPTDILFAVIETPDRLQHAYYRYLDSTDDAYDSNSAASIRPALVRCYESMDATVGLLEDYAGSDGSVLVCSDHGFTAWDVSVHTNALLESWGYLKTRPRARAMQTGAARKLVPFAKRVLPAKVARTAKGKTFSAIDWANTKAFASPIPQQGIFINLEGRERFGVVPQSELETLKGEIVARFEGLRGIDGRPVTDRVWRSETVFTGNALEGAPDLMPVLRDHRYELDDEIFHKDPITDQSRLPRGVHHPNGMAIYAGQGVRSGATATASVLDVTPTLLYMAGLKVPEGLDGSVVEDAFRPDHLERTPVTTMPQPGTAARDESSPYSEDEEAIIEESLRGLGYL